MAIFNGHYGGKKYVTFNDCAKAVLGCISPEEHNEIPTRPGHGQSAQTLEKVLAEIGTDVSKIVVGDIITTNLIPTNSFVEGFAADLSCGLGGWEFDPVIIRQNGITAAGDASFDIGAFTPGSVHTTTYATVAGVTTATVTASAGFPAQFGAAAINVTYSPAHNAEYAGSFVAIGLRVKALPAAADACNAAPYFGQCTQITATWRNLQPCIRECRDGGCTGKGRNVVVLA